ncbi:hypothetical protein [Mesorhizobium sp.]|nr:hypothetical protein [Mesorhizobium sp.]
MTFAEKCKLLAKRRSRHPAPAASDRRLRAVLLPGALNRDQMPA